MKKYFALQCKRVLRYLPCVLLIVALLLGGLLMTAKYLAQQDANSEVNQKATVALCGETEDDFLQMVITALTTMDSSRYSIDILQMSEEDAIRMLSERKIAAYVVFPEGFMDAAMAGELIPLEMYSTTTVSDLTSVFKEELTSAIGDLLASSEKGAFGLDEAIYQEGLPRENHLDNLTFEYVDHIIARDQIYTVEELGIGDQLSLPEYLICGLSVLLLLLCCLIFAPLQIRQDPALNRLLRAKGHSAAAQTLCELGAYGTILLVLGLVVLPLAIAFGGQALSVKAVLNTVPVILMVGAYSFFLFNLSGDIMSGVVLQFFLSLALCFVSGCIYPVYFFPIGVQKVANLLPTGLARTQLAGCFTGEATTAATLGLLGYCVLFAGLSILVRHRKIRGVAE